MIQQFADIIWASLVGDGDGVGGEAVRGVRVVIPIAVIDELDRLKRSGREEVRTRARTTLRTLVQLLGSTPDTPHPLRGGASGSAGSVSTTVEVLLDPPSYQPLAHVDSEIVNRALDLQTFSGRSVQVITADTGLLFRAAAAGLATGDWSAGRRGRG